MSDLSAPSVEPYDDDDATCPAAGADGWRLNPMVHFGLRAAALAGLVAPAAMILAGLTTGTVLDSGSGAIVNTTCCPGG